jgi:hypothetical protein
MRFHSGGLGVRWLKERVPNGEVPTSKDIWNHSVQEPGLRLVSLEALEEVAFLRAALTEQYLVHMGRILCLCLVRTRLTTPDLLST